jgi:CBS domain-containing protein
MTEYRVGALMRTEFVSLSPQTPIRRAVAVLVDSRSAAAAVAGTDRQLVGILTQKDCFQPALHASYHREWSGQVADHMSSEVVSVDVEDEVIRVAEMFLSFPHRVFPVRGGSGVAGLLHRSDVLSFLTKLG